MAKAAPKRLTRRDVVILGIVSIAFTAIWVSFILPFIMDRPLRTFDFRQNDWFDTPDVKIVDRFGRSDLVVANDELFYEINYRNKQSHEIALLPQLQIMYGGEIVQTIDSIEPVTISGDGTGQHRIRFFTDNIGMNQLILSVRVMNSTDSTLFEPVQTTFNIPVYSQEAAEQYRQNELTFWGIFVSAPIGFFTLLALYANVTLSRRQTEELRKQNELTMQRMTQEEIRHDSESRDRREKVIGEHTAKIIEGIKNTFAGKNDGREVVGFDWIDTIEHSGHSKRFIRHLYTDRMDLFNILSEAVATREKAQSKKVELFKKIELLIMSAIPDAGNNQNNPTEQKRFAAEAADYLMENVGTEGFKIFEAQFKETMGSLYYTTQPGFHYSLVYPERERASAISSALNEIAARSEIIEECRNHQELTLKAVTLSRSCENRFEDLLSAVRTHGTQMQGACEDCIKEYDEPDVSKLQAAFSELEKTSLYSHLVGKEE